MSSSSSPALRCLGRALALAFAFALVTATAAAAQSGPLNQIQAMLDRGEPEKALAELETIKKPNAEALLLRSTAYIMVGDPAKGYADLQRAVEIDPGLRQAWLNIAGLEIAEGNYDKAYDALLRAEKIDPAADDNQLNLGAVQVMQGKLDEAAKHFERYLERNRDSAEAHYLVASNYALAGHESEVVEYLGRAISLDEHMRMRARSDERFVALSGVEYRRLLTTDSYQLPPGGHTRAAAFTLAYDHNNPELVYVVLDALKQDRLRYDPSIEATDFWALIWTDDFRIKIYNQNDGTGVVSLSAPPERFTPEAWQVRSQKLMTTIFETVDRHDRQKLGLTN